MVTLIETWGSVEAIVEIAKHSHKGKVGNKEQNLSFLRKILQKGHTSVLEFAGATFRVKTPIFVARQWMRHRTASYLEVSRRYTKVDETCIPENTFKAIYEKQLDEYYDLLSKGYPKEQARGVLGVGFLTEFFVSANLRSWSHFLELRLAKDAQQEIREEAEEVSRILSKKFGKIFERG